MQFFLKTLIVALCSMVLKVAAEPAFMKTSSRCASCIEIDRILAHFTNVPETENQMDDVLKLSATIQKIHLRGKSKEDQQREIYFSINATIEVLTADFDSETVLRLMDLRSQNPQLFDEVFWTFAKGQQSRIVERMQAFISDRIRPKGKVPQIKSIG